MAPLRPFPPELLPGDVRSRLDGRLSPSSDGGQAGALVLTTVEDLPPRLPEGMTWTVLPGTERRELLLGVRGARNPLADLPPGTRVGIETGPGGRRLRALLRALHPHLEPGTISPGDPSPPPVRILPLWSAPELESRGEVLDPATWLPAPGQGIPVLLHPAGALPDGVVPDPGGTVVARAERAVQRALAPRIVCVRAQAFGAGLRLAARVLSPDGRQMVRGALQGSAEEAEALGRRLARRLLEQGADLLAAVDA